MEHLNWLHLILAMFGGMIGAAIGAFPAFFLCGLCLIIGTIITLITGDQSFNIAVTWGPVIGPHTAFAGGVAAAAFAARKGKLDSGRNIVKPLYSKKSINIFLIGATFGLLGILFSWIFSLVPTFQGTAWLNPIALSITVNRFSVRFLIGKTGLLGTITKHKSIWITSPEENILP